MNFRRNNKHSGGKKMSIKIDNCDSIMTVKLEGEIDHHLAKGMREEIDQLAQRTRPTQMILDFKDVTFMDSSGIGLVMGRYRLMEITNGKLKVVNTSPHIKKVMKLAGLDRLAEIQ